MDPVLLWLWRRPVATAPILGNLYIQQVALKSPKKKGKKKKNCKHKSISSPNILPDNKKIKRKEMIGMKEILYKSNISIDFSSVKKKKKENRAKVTKIKPFNWCLMPF